MYRSTLFSILFLCLCLLTAVTASAQSRYLSAEENGIEIFTGFDSGEDFNSLRAGLGYSFGAKFDLGFSASRTVYNEHANLPERHVQFTPYASAILLRPDNTLNLGIEIEASYGMLRFTDDWLDYMDLDMTGNAFAAGVSFYNEIANGSDLTILPAIALFRVDQTVKIEDNFGVSDEASNNNFALIARLSFVFTETFHVSPSVTNIDDQLSWGITVGRLIH